LSLGLYFPGRFGVCSEVDMIAAKAKPRSPDAFQTELVRAKEGAEEGAFFGGGDKSEVVVAVFGVVWGC
jgi:hypothetical protein